MIIAKDLMTKKVFTIQDMSTVSEAQELMKKHGIRHLPVMNQEGRLVGLLSDRDVQRASSFKYPIYSEDATVFNSSLVVDKFMSWPIQTIDENTSVKDLAKIMISEKASALVVNAKNSYIKGIITSEDVLQYLVELIDSSEDVTPYPAREIFVRNNVQNEIRNL
jgi:acetoin utilization protein AcuB